MFRTIGIFGLIAGAIVTAPFFLLTAVDPSGKLSVGMLFGYLIMLLALSMVFVGVKRVRDVDGGGVIKFLPALGVGLGISFVASVIYVIGWEITLAITHYGFANAYAVDMVEKAKESGATAAQVAQVTAQMQAFKAQYADPLFRLPITFVEIFPVGVVIAVISAGLLRNSRFLPVRR
jgi:hypothetical protein